MNTKNHKKKTIATYTHCDCGGEFVYNKTYLCGITSGDNVVRHEYRCSGCGKKALLVSIEICQCVIEEGEVDDE